MALSTEFRIYCALYGYNAWYGDGAGNTVENSSVFSLIRMCYLLCALILAVGQQEGHASVNLSLHHKVQKFFSGTGSPGWFRKKGRKTVVCVCVVIKNKQIFYFELDNIFANLV